MTKSDKYERIADLAKRRGFFWQSFELYGGAGGYLDFGPAGVALRRHIEVLWRQYFVQQLGLYEISTPVIMPESVFEASGHVKHFQDPLVECISCKKKFRADHVIKEATGLECENLSLEELEMLIRKREVHCPECGRELGRPQYFRTMFVTTIGPYSESIGYGRPEAAQGMFIDFKRVLEIAREKFPFGIAQIGPAMRNEISPRQGPIRLREFTIMEFEFFFDPEEQEPELLNEYGEYPINLLPIHLRSDPRKKYVTITVRNAFRQKLIRNAWSACFMVLSAKFVKALGIPSENQRFLEKMDTERAHYSAQTFDLEVELERLGWIELAGCAYRTDYDLSAHMKKSGTDLRIFKPYETPVTTRKLVAIPLMNELGPVYKSRAKEISEMIARIDPAEIVKAFSSQGFYENQGFKILPSQVRIEEQEIRETGRRFVPHVVEPSFGAERLVYATLEYAYRIREDRAVLCIPRKLAPYHASVLPLMSKNGLPKRAKMIQGTLEAAGFDIEYDEAGSIGRRYARCDEIGIPIAVTIDYQTLQDSTITLRDRDSWKQIRVSESQLIKVFQDFFMNEKPLETLGDPFESKYQED